MMPQIGDIGMGPHSQEVSQSQSQITAPRRITTEHFPALVTCSQESIQLPATLTLLTQLIINTYYIGLTCHLPHYRFQLMLHLGSQQVWGRQTATLDHLVPDPLPRPASIPLSALARRFCLVGVAPWVLNGSGGQNLPSCQTVQCNWAS